MALATSGMRDLPLVEKHMAHGASFEPVCDWRIPSRYGMPLLEHEAARATAGLSDFSHQGRIVIRGPDRHGFLDRLLSNDIRDMAPGDAVAACLLTAVGTVAADVTVYDRGDDLLCVLRPEGTAPFVAGVQAHLPESRSRMESIGARGVMLFITGPAHERILETVLGERITGAARGCRRIEWSLQPVWLLAYPAQQSVDHLVEVPSAVAPRLFDALLEAGRADGLRLVGRDAQEILRIEAGRPLLGTDMDGSHDPAEVNLEHTVSPAKTQYRGWEHVAARRERGGPVWRLMGVQSHRPFQPGTVLVGDGRVLGRITSATWSPCLGAPLGLAVIPSRTRPESLFLRGAGGEHPAALRDVPVAA